MSRVNVTIPSRVKCHVPRLVLIPHLNAMSRLVEIQISMGKFGI